SLWLLFSFTLTVTTLSYTLSLHDALPICDRVILLRLGQREALRLKESELSAGAVAQTSTSRAYQPPPSVPEPSVDQGVDATDLRSEEHTSELQSRENLVCRLLLEKKKKTE